MWWQDLTWDEVKKLITNIQTAILPIGSCEQHSLHLPLGMDTYSVLSMAKKLSEDLEGKVFILPPIWYGFSPHHMKFTGTITLSYETLMNLVYDIAKSLAYHGIKKLIILNGHGGNIAPLTLTLRRIKDELELTAVLVNPWELAGDEIKEIIESKIWGHACEFETSVAFVEIPEKVRQNKIKKPRIITPNVKHFAFWEKEHVVYPWDTDEFTDTGSIGDPTRASNEKGEKIFNAMYIKTLKFVKKFIS